jgi:hypothetical protein
LTDKHFLLFGRVDHDPAETLVRACDPDSTPESGDTAALLSVPSAFAHADLIRLLAAGIFAGRDWCPDSAREDSHVLPFDPREQHLAPWVTRLRVGPDGSVVVS